MTNKFKIATGILVLSSVLGLTACGGLGSSTTTATAPTKLLSAKSSPSDVAKSLAGDWVLCDDGFGVVAKIQPVTGEWNVNVSPVGFLMYPEKDCKGEGKPQQPKDSDEQGVLDMFANWKGKFEKVSSQDGKILIDGLIDLSALDVAFGGDGKNSIDKVIFTISADGNTLTMSEGNGTKGLLLYKRLPKK